MADVKVTNSHYIKEGVEYLRVNEVLSIYTAPQLTDWIYKVRKTEANKVKKAALKVGTKVHKAIENDWKGEGSDTSDFEADSCMEGYRKWQKDYNYPNIISMEQTSFCEERKVAGTYDIELIDTLVDVKTSNQISINYWVQNAIYNRISKLNKKYIAILRLDKNMGIYEYEVREMDEALVEVFDAHLELYNYYKEGK